jgi:alkylhydroperoxidase family enzyme
MDIGSAVGRAAGISEQQILAISDFRSSTLFAPAEVAALELADAMARTPAEVSSELYAELQRHFDAAQLVELAAAISWEHHRARFNRVFEIQSDDFSEGAACVLPARGAGLRAAP